MNRRACLGEEVHGERPVIADDYRIDVKYDQAIAQNLGEPGHTKDGTDQRLNIGRGRSAESVEGAERPDLPEHRGYVCPRHGERTARGVCQQLGLHAPGAPPTATAFASVLWARSEAMTLSATGNPSRRAARAASRDVVTRASGANGVPARRASAASVL